MTAAGRSRPTNRTARDGQFSGRYEKETSSLFSAGWLFGQEGPSSGDVTCLSTRRVLVPKRSRRRSQEEREGGIKFPWSSDRILTLKNSSVRRTRSFRSSPVSHGSAPISADDSRFASRRLAPIAGVGVSESAHSPCQQPCARRDRKQGCLEGKNSRPPLLRPRVLAGNATWSADERLPTLYTLRF